jgi:hypothetical protein
VYRARSGLAASAAGTSGTRHAVGGATFGRAFGAHAAAAHNTIASATPAHPRTRAPVHLFTCAPE